MKLTFATLAIATAGIVSAPAFSTAVLPATNMVDFSPFDLGTQGSLLASKTSSDQGLTFAGDIRLAVYRNILGTLDFYYQYQRTGPGTVAADSIETITGSSFRNYLVDAMFSDADVDGTNAGIFTASDNAGDPATASRNSTGSVVGIDFAPSNPIAGNQTSATYIFRTNAVNFSTGTFGVIDGSTVSGLGYQPAAAVPEMSTWAMMVVGFGSMGAMMRRRRTQVAWQG